MKRIIIALLMLLPFIGFGQACSDEDTVRSITSSLVTATSARINGSVSHFSGAVTGLQLRYVRSGQTDTATASGSFSSALRNLNGLQASTVYIYYYKTICGSGTARNSIGPFAFTTLSNNVLYAPERPTVFNYVKADSGLRIPSVDTSLYRAAAGASIVYKTSDDTYYAYYVDCSCWRSLATDSAGVIAALDLKVDSVTISGDSLFWWNNHGVSHGYILPVINNMWKTTGNSGTTPGTNFIGTTDAQSLVIKTNAIERMRFNTSGAIAVGSGTDYGTSGYVLKSNGNAAAPTWVDPSGIGRRFGVSGEDATSAQNRTFTTSGYQFQIYGVNGLKQQLFRFTPDSTMGIFLRNNSSADIAYMYINGSDSSMNLKGGRPVHGSGIHLLDSAITLTPNEGVINIDSIRSTGSMTRKNVLVWDTVGGGVYQTPVSSIATTPSLTDTQIAFGDGSNLMTSSSDLTWNSGIFTIKGTPYTHNFFGVEIGNSFGYLGDIGGDVNGNYLKVDDANSLSYYDNTAHDGKFGINTASPTEALDVVGNIVASGTITPSDIRWKENFGAINNGLLLINKLQPRTFEYKQDTKRKFNKGLQYGLIAQEVEKFIPEIVTTDINGYKGIQYNEITPILIKAVQELSSKVDKLEKQNAELVKKLAKNPKKVTIRY